MANIEQLVRKNIVPYSSARDEYSGEDAIFLDANENPYPTGANRYPDPMTLKLKVRIGQVKNIHYENIFLGNGSDEAIDLLIRAFCEPGKDNIVSFKPTYGMYKVCADISHVEYREALLTRDFQMDKTIMSELTGRNTKLIFLCSPNNPTSNSLIREDIIYLLENFEGLVVLDEAYIDFSGQHSFLPKLNSYPNLVILQTLSKAWGMAGIRLGMAFASREIINILNKIKYPYNINILTQSFALERLTFETETANRIAMILAERDRLRAELSLLPFVMEVLPSDANFLMVRFTEPKKVLHYLLGKKIIVRDRSKIPLCEGCLRITVGTSDENGELMKALKKYKTQPD
jgi:histidinol-phosphate aminotransferase